MTAEGNGGTLSLFQDRIRITRGGFDAWMHKGTKGDKDIPLSAITSIRFSPTPAMLQGGGYIQFSIAGAKEAKPGFMKAHSDENSILFFKNQEPGFLRIKAMIEARLAEMAAGPSPGSTVNDMEQLEKLAALRDRGVVTDAEFEAKKKQILGL